MSEKFIGLSSAYHTMFSLFPPQKEIHGQIKLLTMEIVKIHIAEGEHRVAHLILSNACKQYENDPYLWNLLAKLYLDIGKRESAVNAFKKEEECWKKLGEEGKVPKTISEFSKNFSK